MNELQFKLMICFHGRIMILFNFTMLYTQIYKPDYYNSSKSILVIGQMQEQYTECFGEDQFFLQSNQMFMNTHNYIKADEYNKTLDMVCSTENQSDKLWTILQNFNGQSKEVSQKNISTKIKPNDDQIYEQSQSSEYSQPELSRQVQESSERRQSRKTLKKRKNSKKNDYQTKNLLQVVTKCHFDYLLLNICELPTQIKVRISESKYLTNKKPMNREEFVELYAITELQQIWKRYFKTRQLYRDIMRSRANIQNKLKFIPRLHVFEQAFIDKEFEHIN